jgi:uncharacterized damage-inducible protein DinB
MTPEHAHFLAQTVGQNLQREWMLTYKVISAIPEHNKNWKPDATSRSAWELASHIAAADVGFLNGVFDLSYSNAFPKITATTVEELAAWYKHAFPTALERVMALDGVHLAKHAQFYSMDWAAARFVFFCNNHMIHHRGQLAAYLRPMGGRVPSIYGSSADEPYQPQ